MHIYLIKNSRERTNTIIPSLCAVELLDSLFHGRQGACCLSRGWRLHFAQIRRQRSIKVAHVRTRVFCGYLRQKKQVRLKMEEDGKRTIDDAHSEWWEANGKECVGSVVQLIATAKIVHLSWLIVWIFMIVLLNKAKENVQFDDIATRNTHEIIVSLS